MNLLINNNVSIPFRELKWRFSRSSGSGGQNINKIDSRVEIIFSVKNSKVLNNYQKIKLRNNISSKLINDCVHIVVQEQRTQYKNRQIALKKMANLIKDALNKKQIIRIQTKLNQSSHQKRLKKKKERGELKKTRRLIFLN